MRFAVSAGHELVVQAAREIMAEGGNAFDAAIAAFAATWVMEPCMSGPGGGAFALTRTAGGKVQLFDFFCQTPKKKSVQPGLDFYPVTVDFGDNQEEFHIGAASVAVPGAVKGLWTLYERFATLPIAVLLEPAIRYARYGVEINAFQYYDFQLLEDIIRVGVRSREIYFSEGQLKSPGSVIYLPNMADFMDTLAIEGPSVFYVGEVARLVVQYCREKGGMLEEADFASYQVIERQPLQWRKGDLMLYANTFPSQGAALMALYLEQLPSDINLAKMDRHEYFLHLTRAAEYCSKVSRNETELRILVKEKIPAIILDEEATGPTGRGGTTHLNVVDEYGNAVSLSSSLGEGCGFFIPGTDIQLNNMLGEKALLPGGFHSWEPDTRMGSMMTPVCGEKPGTGHFWMMGSGGAGRIPYALAQVILRAGMGGMLLRDSIELPRMHFTEGVFNVEPSLTAKLPGKVGNYPVREWERPSLYFGGVHAVEFNNGKLDAHADSRRDGVYLVKE